MLGAIVITLVFGSIAGVLWLGGHDVLAGRITAGELSAFVFYATVVASAFGGLSDVFGDLQRAAGATERLFELLDAPAVITAPDHPTPLPVHSQGALRFEQVSFAYPSHPERLVLAALDLAVRPGETVALVGPSGAGKTSVFQLLMRYYDPNSRSHPVRWRADHPARAPGVPLADRSRAAGAGDLLGRRLRRTSATAGPPRVRPRSVPPPRPRPPPSFSIACREGFATFLGEKGVRLSGGQRQRLAIARAILCDPAVLLLDEATSALDAENERLVQLALERLMRGRTSLVIAHRLATVLKADRIVVLDEGQVVEQGRHEDLLGRGGLYARLAELQFTRGEAA